MNKKMFGAISAVALTMGTAGCSTPPADNTNTSVQVGENKNVPDSMKECKNLELVQGDAYSGKDKEVWYCADDDNDSGSHFSGMFFYPLTGQYYDAKSLKKKHKVNVTSYKPGTSAKKVSVSEYNKAAKLKLPPYQPKTSVKSTTNAIGSKPTKPSSTSKPKISSSTKSKSSVTSSPRSSYKSSSSSSRGFGSSFSSSSSGG